jgi:hypothetical protein
MLGVEIGWEFVLWYTECKERDGEATGNILNHMFQIKFIKGTFLNDSSFFQSYHITSPHITSTTFIH